MQLKRKELYDRVWAEPIQKLAKEYGLSDVGLAKVCRRHAIPVPPRGYWARKHAGQRVTRTALPPSAPKGYGDTIQLIGPDDQPAKGEREEPRVHPLVAAESDPANAITVPDELQIRHPLLRSTRAYWRFVKQPGYRWDAPAPPHRNLDVGVATRPRSLRLLQALFAALERRGHRVTAGEHGQAAVMVLDEKIGLYLRERQRQVRTAAPKKSATGSIYDRPRPFDLVRFGELELRIEKRFGRDTMRDGKDHPLERQLNDVIVRLLNAAFAEKAHRAKAELERLAEIERQRQRAMAQQLAREEHARVGRLEGLMAGAARHKQLVAFAAELRTAIGRVDPTSELGRWLDWVDGYVKDADVLDRFRHRQPHLTLYYCVAVYEADNLVRNGFRDQRTHDEQDKDLPASVPMTDVPMARTYGGSTCVIVEMPEDDAIPYESSRADEDFRRFNLPAAVVNRCSRRLHGH